MTSEEAKARAALLWSAAKAAAERLPAPTAVYQRHGLSIAIPDGNDGGRELLEALAREMGAEVRLDVAAYQSVEVKTIGAVDAVHGRVEIHAQTSWPSTREEIEAAEKVHDCIRHPRISKEEALALVGSAR